MTMKSTPKVLAISGSDVLSGGGLIIDALFLVVQNKSIIADAASHNRAAAVDRVVVDVEVFQLGRGNGGRGMGNHKAKLGRQTDRKSVV